MNHVKNTILNTKHILIVYLRIRMNHFVLIALDLKENIMPVIVTFSILGKYQYIANHTSVSCISQAYFIFYSCTYVNMIQQLSVVVVAISLMKDILIYYSYSVKIICDPICQNPT